MPWYRRYEHWKPYVPVAKRRAQAARAAESLAKRSKRPLSPVKIEGRKIAASFWGKAWCENLERYSDFANRLPRGRTYVRNGSVLDLQIAAGEVTARVSGSSLYTVTIKIDRLAKPVWKRIRQDCSQSIDSLIDLLRGRFEQPVMERLTRAQDGLFPQPPEIKMSCSCPDWAGLCKHVAATLYGVGARLDSDPELLFTLRDIDHLDLVGQAVSAENLDRTLGLGGEGSLAGSDLGELFGIELDQGTDAAVPGSAEPSPAKQAPRKSLKRKRSASIAAPRAATRPKVAASKKTRAVKSRVDVAEGKVPKKRKAAASAVARKLKVRTRAGARAK